MFNGEAKMIIVNADDYGCSHEVNEAIKESFLKGYIDRTTLMVNMPYADEAVQMARNAGYADKVGLHLNLTTGRPITDKCKVSVFTNNGEFNNLFYKVDKRKRFYLSRSERSILRAEVEAQIEKYKDYCLPLMHLDAHHHVHTNLSTARIIITAAKKAGFKSVRICRSYPDIKESALKKFFKIYINKLFRRVNCDKCKELYMLQRTDFQTTKFGWYHDECELEIECHPMYGNGGMLLDGKEEQLQFRNLNANSMETLAREVNNIRESATY